MDTLVSHNTALRLLRDPELNLADRPTNARVLYAPPSAMDSLTARELSNGASALRRAGEPLDFATSDPHGARSHASYVSHVFGMQLPARSIIDAGSGLWCCGAELTALQLAGCLSELQLVVLLCELMGTYAISPAVVGGIAQRPRPLTDPDRLDSFLADSEGVRGAKALRRAAKLAFAGSASPYETKLALRLCLPAKKGGYGLKLLSMNEGIAVERLGGTGNQRLRRPDILIAPYEGSGAKPVALEYDGEASHMTREGVLSDTLRGNELKAMGISEYRINKALYRDINYMEDIVALVRAEAGYPRRHRSPEFGYRQKLRHIELYKQLERASVVL